MKKNKWTNEFKVGLFVLACLLGLAYMTYSTGKLGINKDSGYFVYVVFDEAAGMDKKAPVMLNGLEIGKVEDIKPSYEGNKTHITLKLWLENKAKVRENSEISIKMMGLMGEKYVQIESSNSNEFVTPGSTLNGQKYVDLDVFVRNLNAVVEENRQSVKDAIKHLDQVLANLDGTLSDNRDNLAKAIKNFETTSENFEEFSDDLRRNPWKILFKTKEKPKDPTK